MRFLLLVSLALFTSVCMSCSHESVYKITTAYDTKTLVTRDKLTMEKLIDCSITRQCGHETVMELFPGRQALFLKSGTRVTVTVSMFAFSDAVRVHVLEGEHAGEDVWVYNRILNSDKGNVRDQVAFVRLWQ
jgi:hypothetical protein